MSGEQMFGGPETTGNAQPILIVDANAGDLGDRLYLSDLSGFASDGMVITRDGVRVGTVDPVENGQDGAALKIFLDPGADREAIDALSNALRFETIADDPASGAIAATVRIVGGDALDLDGALEIEVAVPVLPFEGLLGESFDDDILAAGLGSSPSEPHAGKFLFVSNDFLESAETGTYSTVIHGFTPGQGGNVLDLGSVLKDGTYGGGSLEGFVQLDDSSGTHTVLRVDIFGTGNYTDLAIIEGTTGLGNADTLVDSGNIVV